MFVWRTVSPRILWVLSAIYSSLLNSSIPMYPLKKWQLNKGQSPETKKNFRCRTNKCFWSSGATSHFPQGPTHPLQPSWAPTLRKTPYPASQPFLWGEGSHVWCSYPHAPGHQYSTETVYLEGARIQPRLTIESLWYPWTSMPITSVTIFLAFRELFFLINSR